MAIAKYVWVVCNKCPEIFIGGEGMSARATRSHAKDKGWYRTREADFCPSCAKDIAAAVKEAALGNIP